MNSISLSNFFYYSMSLEKMLDILILESRCFCTKYFPIIILLRCVGCICVGIVSFGERPTGEANVSPIEIFAGSLKFLLHSFWVFSFLTIFIYEVRSSGLYYSGLLNKSVIVMYLGRLSRPSLLLF